MGYVGILATAGLVWVQNYFQGTRNWKNTETKLGRMRLVWIKRFRKVQGSDLHPQETTVGQCEARVLMILLIIMAGIAGDCLLVALKNIIV